MTIPRFDIQAARHPSNPMIGYGPSGSWYEANIFDPWVMDDPTDSTKMMMYTSGQYKPVGTGLQVIGLWRCTKAAFLANPGTCWQFDSIVLTQGASGTWDVGGVRLGSVVVTGGSIYIFYTGGTATGASNSAIGVAQSTDGLTGRAFTKSASNPVLTAAGGGRNDGIQLGEPDVHFDGTTWTMIYDYRTSTVVLPGYRYATASAPAGPWTKGGAGDIFSTPAPIKPQCECHRSYQMDDGSWVMVFEAGISVTYYVPYRIKWATAPALIGPYTLQGDLLPEDGYNPGGLDYYYVATPFLYQLNGIWYLFYQGANQVQLPGYNNQWRLNLATLVSARAQFAPSKMAK